MNILLVKLSSLGDVLHNLPIVWDVRARFPEARVDWVVEEGYVDLLEPLRTREGFRGVDNVISIALRRWKKGLFKGETWAELGRCRAQLRQTPYDLVIETQGLIKSALVTRMAGRAPGAVIAGLANRTDYSGYEPLARLFYNRAVQVPAQCHAVDRSRRVAAAAMDMAFPERAAALPRFFPDGWLPVPPAGYAGLGPYALCFHATARDAKRWADENWVVLGRELADHGLTVLFPWGNAAERAISERLAARIPGARVPEAFRLQEAFGIIAGASLTLGVDTGLTHLSAVLGRPTVELYCDSPRWKTEGYWSPLIRNLGDLGAPPEAAEVVAAACALLDRS
ncbi:MAG: lipopolysaccharide heptosyltransferase I [Rhodocyclaceae bacterium]|nr:lipopolysaccharide heptosyltransferase I [Rhodocyclaceae bacterium]